jgi:hypothetical protein
MTMSEITNNDDLQVIVGHTIVAAHRAPDSRDPWACGENTVTLTLDNGAQVEFVGWGYDASGVVTTFRSNRLRISEDERHE